MPKVPYELARENAATHLDAQHEMTHPAHAQAFVRQLSGQLDPLLETTEDDPLLYAYLLNDRLPAIAALVINLRKWSTAVIEATPDQIFETGAQPCRYTT